MPASTDSIPLHSLVLYKNRPALVRQVGKKLEIALEAGDTTSVRPKDVTLLHPGPLTSLNYLKAGATLTEEVLTAWELLAGQTTSLAELAELIYNDFTPVTAWAVWELAQDGLYFKGAPDGIRACTAAEVAETKAARAAKEAEKAAWEAFARRAAVGQSHPADERYLQDVVELALQRREQSRVLRELGQAETRENAHALLLRTGYWDETVNPYPQRFQLELAAADAPLPPLAEEARLDLTHLAAYAIDDAGSADPDDALSLDGQRLWVHVADAAALVTPDSPADQKAQARGANLYLPEGTIAMLPPAATSQLGLGLNEISPALSFGLDFDAAGQITHVEIVPSWVRVTRTTYAEIEERLGEEPFAGIWQLTRRFHQQRQAAGAVEIDLPEVKIRVDAGRVVITPLPPLRSRELVREAMLMAGVAAANFALERNIPLPYSAQEPPNEVEPLPGMAGMFALRRSMKRSQRQSAPAPHAGLGLSAYVQTTSPLRRYLDLVAHQQLRAYVRGEPVLDMAALMARVGVAEAISGSVRQVERLSNQHWTLVYFLQNPDWEGEGVVVEKNGARSTLLIPELAWESQVYLRHELPLNARVRLAVTGVNLPELTAYFREV
ncbi:MAG: RNB domain-containing ribonuclease [Candidatus Promineifilaceae bacterium]